MPTQSNYDHIKSELFEAKLKIIELQKQIDEYKQLKKVSFDQEVKVDIQEIKQINNNK